MLLVIGAYGGVDWQKTSKYFKENYNTLAQQGWLVGIPGMGTKSFDATNDEKWHAFRCISCTRILPIDCSDLDHISPRSGLSWYVDVTQRDMSHFGSKTVGWHSQPPFARWTVALSGQVGVIADGSAVITIHNFRVPNKQDCILVKNTPAVGGLTTAPAADLAGKVRELTDQARRLRQPAPTTQQVARMHPPQPPPPPKQVLFHPGKFPKPTQPVADEWRLEFQKVLENNLENLMLLCPHCNRSKGAKS